MKPSILYIDDEPQNLISFKASFREEFKISIANSASEGLEILNSRSANSFQIIIADQRMPVMNGDEFFTHIPEIHQHATRILLTAFTDIDAAKRALNKGKISFFYNKPYDEDELKKVLFQGCKLFDKKIQLENEVEEVKNISKLQIQKIVNDYEEDREALSEELHEEFAQKLAGLKFFLSALESSKNSSNFSDIVEKINEVLESSINNIQEVCFEVMPRSIKKFGLKEPLIELIEKFKKTPNINPEITKLDLPKLSIGSMFFIYRTFGEILNSFSISSTQLTNLEIAIEDNLRLTFNGISTISNWKMNESLTSKIEAYNGKIIQEEDSLELQFKELS